MKKRTFLLLEILIAFSLVTLCIIPLVQNPVRWARSEFKKLELLEQERIADWTYTEIHEMFLKNEIPWKTLPEKGQTTAPTSLLPASIHLPGRKEKKIARSFTLACRGAKEGAQGHFYRQIYITILMNNQKYVYRLPVMLVSTK